MYSIVLPNSKIELKIFVETRSVIFERKNKISLYYLENNQERMHVLGNEISLVTGRQRMYVILKRKFPLPVANVFEKEFEKEISFHEIRTSSHNYATRN